MTIDRSRLPRRLRSFRECEVNGLLRQWHTFDDWALLRRVLFDWRFVDREPDGSRYRLRRDAPWGLEAEASGPPSL